MAAVAQQTLLNLTSEVVNHPDTLVLPDGTNLMGDGHFQFSNRLRTILIHMFIQEPPKIKKKSDGFRLGGCGDHSGSPRLQ